MAITLEQLTKAQLHVGSRKQESHPKTSRFRLGVSNNVVVINPETIMEQLETAKEKVQNYLKAGKDVLFITPQATIADEMDGFAVKHKIHYLNDKIPAGFLTNFDVLKIRIKAMNTLREFIASTAYENLTKKEKMMRKRALKKVERVYKGVQYLSKKPDLVVVLDAVKNDGIVDELSTTGIDNILITSTNFNRRWDKEMVVANTGSYTSIAFILKYILSGAVA